MSIHDDLYSELKGDIELVASPLFDASELFLKRRGSFLPHGAILKSNGEVEIVNFAPENFETRKVNALEVLPGLHKALREAAFATNSVALGVAEDVSITLEGSKVTKAIKVLFEHKKGLAVALYLPWKRKLFGGIEIGDPISTQVEAEVCVW